MNTSPFPRSQAHIFKCLLLTQHLYYLEPWNRLRFFSLRYSGLCLHLFKNHSHHMVSPWKSTFCNMFFFSDGRIKLHGWEREEPYYQTGSKRKKDSYFVQEHIVLLLVLTHSVIICFSTGRPHSFYCKANCHTWVAANSIWTTQLSLHKITKRGNFQHADLHTSRAQFMSQKL